MNTKVRARIVITGRVQGVFFRMETKYKAEEHGVSGWVRNRSDGTVEAVLEGDRKKVESVIQWCTLGPAAAKVEKADPSWEDFKDEFIGFEIIR